MLKAFLKITTVFLICTVQFFSTIADDFKLSVADLRDIGNKDKTLNAQTLCVKNGVTITFSTKHSEWRKLKVDTVELKDNKIYGRLSDDKFISPKDLHKELKKWGSKIGIDFNEDDLLKIREFVSFNSSGDFGNQEILSHTDSYISVCEYWRRVVKIYFNCKKSNPDVSAVPECFDIIVGTNEIATRSFSIVQNKTEDTLPKKN